MNTYFKLEIYISRRTALTNHVINFGEVHCDSLKTFPLKRHSAWS